MMYLCKEIIRIYNKAPGKISFLWLLNIIELFAIQANPYIIGECIDALQRGEFKWLYIFAFVELIYLLAHGIDMYLDTRIYSRIIEDENNQHFERMICQGVDTSTINSRLELVECIPNFLECDSVEILKMVVGIIVSLAFIRHTSDTTVFLIAIATSTIIPILTYNLQSKIVKKRKEHDDLDEERARRIESRSLKIFEKYIKSVLENGIQLSDLESLLFIITYLSQTILMIVSILAVVFSHNFSGGLLYSTVVYVGMLNDNAGEICEKAIYFRDIVGKVNRLYSGNYAEE